MANTVIGSTIVVDGEISGEETVIVQGTVKGRIATSENLFVESSGKLEADVECDQAEIGGSVTGNITAGGRVELKADGKMVGDVKAPRINIADGALFKGNIDMDVGR
ncbi:MAG: bactofilin family protein [Planctomycetota bacterium]|jgi:cytoskeletal protein CcmA (bactofilin family)